MNPYLPIALIVISNVFYHICAKSTPSAINPFAALTVTYAVSTVVTVLLFFTIGQGTNLLAEYKNLNWTSFVFGLALVGLEVGSVYMYKAGWDISVGQLVYSALLAICLLIVGVVAYHESISLTKLIGIAVCMFGLFLINKA